MKKLNKAEVAEINGDIVLNAEELAKMELLAEKQRAKVLEYREKENSIRSMKMEIANLNLEVNVRQLRIEAGVKALEDFKAKIDTEALANKDYNKMLETKYGIVGKWGYDPDSGKVTILDD